MDAAKAGVEQSAELAPSLTKGRMFRLPVPEKVSPEEDWASRKCQGYEVTKTTLETAEYPSNTPPLDKGQELR